jgi:hypothetical protein
MLATLAVLVGCESRPAVTIDSGVDSGAVVDSGVVDSRLDQAQGDGPSADAPRPDAAIAPDLAPPDASSADFGPCGCKPGEVWHTHACLPMGCGPSCDPKVPNACGKNATCEQWGAWACCICSAAVPACVPKVAPAPIKGPLRMQPTSGIAGQPVKLTIEGSPFYVGALFYYVRMGSQKVMDQPGPKQCTITATLTPPKPGIYAVEVSQYGGQPPWVLAGFYTASGGSIPMPSVQPGYPCNPKPAPGDPTCAQAPPYSCACVAGQCVCK